MPRAKAAILLHDKRARTRLRRWKRRVASVPWSLPDAAKLELISLLNIMMAFQDPPAWCRLVCLVATAGLAAPRDLDHVEYFAGCMAVTRALIGSGRSCVGYEILRDAEGMDILGDIGFLNALALALRVRGGGGILAAPVCSTWVYMNRGTSRRSVANPHGDGRVLQVREANCMVSRVMLLCYVAAARGLLFVVEQPTGSLMEKHAAFQEMLRRFAVYRKSIVMEHFGAGTRKPTWLYSNSQRIDSIDQYRFKAKAQRRLRMVRKHIDANGRKRVSAGPDLKRSQAYPEGFGHALTDLYIRNGREFHERSAAMHDAGLTCASQIWAPSGEDLAQLERCIRLLE